ncbi:MAG: hypothetical protein ABI808_13110 [Pseudonocardiales bacterium]
MTAVSATRERRLPLRPAGRLLRLELRRNAMIWMLPLVAALFWFVVYRRTVAYPPSWSLRVMSMQTSVVSVFVPTVVGAGAWVGSREGRHAMTGLLAGTARPRWMRQLAAWAATTSWVVVAYLVCVGVLYAVTASQVSWGGPLWWPAVVAAASVPAFSALGFAAGALRPSRFTAPLAAITAFLALEISAQFIHGAGSPWQISPLVAGPWNIGPNEGVATFYHYLPDLPIAQALFLAGLTAAVLGVLGLPAAAGGRWLRRSAAAVTAAGLLVAGTAVALAGTGRLDPHGLIAIPALHSAADDRPIDYTPVCSAAEIPVCLHPAYAAYLPDVAAALAPVLAEVAGLPFAPVRVDQAAATYHSATDNGIEVRLAGGLSGTPPVFHLVLPNQVPGPVMTTQEQAAAVRVDAGTAIVAGVVGAGRDADPAQQAIMLAIVGGSMSDPDPQVAAAASRFAALPAAERHAWLAAHVTALRAGQLTLAQLP